MKWPHLNYCKQILTCRNIFNIFEWWILFSEFRIVVFTVWKRFECDVVFVVEVSQEDCTHVTFTSWRIYMNCSVLSFLNWILKKVTCRSCIFSIKFWDITKSYVKNFRVLGIKWDFEKSDHIRSVRSGLVKEKVVIDFKVKYVLEKPVLLL